MIQALPKPTLEFWRRLLIAWHAGSELWAQIQRASWVQGQEAKLLSVSGNVKFFY
jgi:hypothetical protein